MTLADLGLANLKIRISTKRDDQEKGLKIMRNGVTNNCKKRKGSDDFKVDGGKEKRRRRMEYWWGLTQDCERVFPAMIHRGGWDCEKKPKSHQSSGQSCLRNPGGRDCQDMKKTSLQKENESSRSDHSSRATTAAIDESWEQRCLRNPGVRDCRDMKNSCQKKTAPLQKEKESCSRSDHSSRATTAAIDEGCTTSLTTVGSQLSPTKALRAAQMKKRYAHLIFKATHQAVIPHGDNADPLKQQEERERLQKQEIAEKGRIEQEIKAAQTLLRMRAAEAELKIQRQREREAARMALEKMKKTVEFNDAFQIMRDFESLLNAVC